MAGIGESMFAQESTRIGDKETRRKGDKETRGQGDEEKRRIHPIISPTWISNPRHHEARIYPPKPTPEIWRQGDEENRRREESTP
jgi:hypothetical protein